LTFSATATTLTSGRHRVVISYLSCVQSSVEAEAKDGGWCRDTVGVDAQTVEASVAGAEVWM
jgi:hypothetical protein